MRDVDRTPKDLPPGLVHATHKAYSTYRCRCVPCFEFRAAYDRARYREREGAARRDPEYRIQLAEAAAQRKEEAQAARRAPYMTTVWNLTLESAPVGVDCIVYATRTTLSEASYVALNTRVAAERMAVKEFGRRYGGRPVATATWSQEHIHLDTLEEWNP